MNKIQIITHNGVFHADEVTAVALLKFCCESKHEKFEVTRTRDDAYIGNRLADIFTYIIDVGKQYVPLHKNFDHHQDLNLRASNYMVWLYLKDNGRIIENFADYIEPFMVAISDWDKNQNNIFDTYKGLNLKNYSQIIAGFNRNPNDDQEQLQQFNKAVCFAIDVLENLQYQWQQAVASENTYSRGRKLCDHVIVFDEYCSVWKEKGAFLFAIMPSQQGYAIHSVDSTLAPLPTDIEFEKGCKFMHKARFIAGFDTLENAEKAALKHLNPTSC